MKDLNNFLELLKWRTKDDVINLLKNNKYSTIDYINFLKHIFKKELEIQSDIKNEMNLKLASFPSFKTLDQFDFNFQESINENKIRHLFTFDFIKNKQNVIFIGNPGVGKTHLSISLGIESIKAKNLTYFLHYSKLISELKKAKDRNLLEDRLKYYSRYKVLIIDEIGYLPLDKEIGNIFFQLINKFYEKKSLIITTNKPFNEWGELFNDDVIATAILDRLLHHSIIISINGKSYRTYESLKENGLDISDFENQNNDIHK